MTSLHSPAATAHASTIPPIEVRLQLQRSAFTLDVDMQLPGRGITALFGPSGCGKTTCLRAMAGLEHAPLGWVRVHGEVWQNDGVQNTPRVWRPAHQRALGYVFQDSQLFEHLNVRNNIGYGLQRTPAAQRRVAVYEVGHDESHLRRIGLIGDLRTARERDEFRVFYQPKIDLRSQRVAHVEALLRWQHPVLGNIAPDEFIPLAEHCGLIHEITAFVLAAGLQQASRWRDDGLDIGLAVNLSPMDLLDARLPERVAGLLQAHRFPARELILEITESTVMRDVQSALVTMRALRALGVRLSIDDFGTGHSSLAQLRSLPVDEIKIDKSFVMRLDSSPDDTVIVRSAIEIGHNMGLVVIAEGVEQAGSLDILQRLHCDMVQGYFFSKPIPAEDFRRWHDDFQANATDRNVEIA